MTDKIIEMYVSDTHSAYYTITDGEAIILMPDKDKTYALGPVGTRIWELADGGHKVKEIVDIICEEFKADRNTIIEDVIKFTTDLCKKRILRLSKNKQKLNSQ